jgi:ribonucleases P/MRP protein subunit RPP40
VDSSLRAWDARRLQEGVGPWHVLFSHRPVVSVSDNTLHGATPLGGRGEVRSATNVRVPGFERALGGGERGEWEEQVAGWCEWVGLACLDSPRFFSFFLSHSSLQQLMRVRCGRRLQANDRADPFVALYEAPGPSRVGALTHVRWRGLLPPEFVQGVIDAARSGFFFFLSFFRHESGFTRSSWWGAQEIAGHGIS